MQAGKTITNNTLIRDDFGVFQFDALEGDIVNIFFASINTFDVGCPTVIAPDGSDITGSRIDCCTDAVNCHIRETRIPEMGSYIIYYKPPYYFHSSRPTYSLTYITYPGPNFYDEGDIGDSISPGQVLTNAFNVPGDLDILRFHAESNDVVTIRMSTPGGNHGQKVFMELQAPDGTVIQSTGGYGLEEPSFQAVRLSLRGEYMIVCHDVYGRFEMPYTMSMVKIPGVNSSEAGDGTEMIQPGEMRTAYLGSGDLDAFRFRVIAGDSVRLSMSSREIIPFPLKLHGPDGSLIAVANEIDPNNPTIDVRCLEQTGDYWVVCSAWFGIPGEYTLSLRQYPAVPPSSGTNQYLVAYLCESNRLFLRWPTNALGCWPESAATLNTTDWTRTLGAQFLFVGHHYLEQPSTARQRFYRLFCTNAVSP
jgi:hypothetical protein